MRPVWVFLGALLLGGLLGCGPELVEVAEESELEAEVSSTGLPPRVCGDGICVVSEKVGCPQDCPPVCGDHLCCWETMQECPEDCSLGNLPYCYRN
ncbi:hypothetical protein [Myxococcus qinghaiensis]|uniref:hypothetical protein n=1 Tax=Myxococcus qinghaiensis TaxID=2906758 RepID=UPI0020A76A9F|nr:hypothetical protein [Myxococcus qinghaiensis]MCP3163771.1 hypothetical protein [Myxococcus qinghaiensis]